MKKVFIISIILSMFLSNIVYAEKVDIECNVIDIDGSHANFMYNDVFIKVQDGHMWPFLWTGKEFFKSDVAEENFYISSDLNEWENVYFEDELRRKIFYGMYSPDIKFAGGKYIVYNTFYFDPSIEIKRVRENREKKDVPIYVLDENFNLLAEHTFDYPISDFGYIDGVYYVQMRGFYIDESNDIKYTTQVYTSADAINWTLDETLKEIPLSNGLKNQLNVQTNLVNWTSCLNRFEIDDIMISSDNLNKTKVSYESNPECQCKVIDDLYVAYQGGLRTFSVSLDGVYWIEIDMPTYKNDFETLFDCYCWNDKLVFRLGYRLLEYDIAEIRNVLNEKCPLDTPYIKLKDNILGFETPPVIEDGSTLVPMRFLFEQMGADVEWNGETQTATATLDNTAVTFAIDDTNAEVNNTPAIMDVPARLINGKTMVPLRFLSENMGYTVDWDAESRTAIINK